MNAHKHIWVVAVLMLAMSGCATYVSTYPRSTGISAQAKSPEKIVVVVSNEDREREEAVGFGLAGFMFPVKVKVGEMLTASASGCLSQFFHDVTVGDAGTGMSSVGLKIEEFYIFGIDAKAHLTLRMTMKNGAGETTFDKTYSGSGSGHFPMYFNEANQRTQVSKTTEEAFQVVFDEIARDLEDAKFASRE